jgi:hypothetical protein
MTISLICWSKDRPSQLFTLLESISRYAPDIFNINIIYRVSNPFFEEGYDKLWKISPIKPLHMKYEEDFEKDTKEQVDIYSGKFVSFATDDCVFYKKVDRRVLLNTLPQFDNCVWSLRLGYNTVLQNIHTGQMQPPLNVHVEHENHLSWPLNYYHPHDNYGYPFGLDLHIFRRSLILPILEEIEFRSTNELESRLTTGYRDRIDEMRSFKHSVAVNIPVNTVSGITRAGEQHGISKEELNQRFLEGWKIDLEKISQEKIAGCHQEISFSFTTC